MLVFTMEAEESTPELKQLLSKRRQLIDLRKKITSQLHNQEATTDNFNPGTPYSDAQPSISPPPFSPLTPLISRNNNGNNNLQCHSGNRSSPFQTTDLMRPLSSPSLLTTTPNNDTGIESPLLPMSPETQKLFDVLNEDEIMNDINEEFFVSKQDERDYCDSDDSVKDPNYNIHDEEDETRSHLSFVCGNVDEEEDSHKDEEKTREQDSNKGREETREEDSNKDGKETREQDSNKDREKTSEEDSNKDGEEIREENSNNDGEEMREEDSDKDEEDIRSNLITGRPKRGRKRINPQLRSERKHNKYHNLEYRTTKNKIIKPKVFTNYQCTCLQNCNSLISVEKRKEEFEKFVQLGSYNAQLLYIGSCIKESNKKRSYTMTNVPAEKKKPKQYNRIYSINGVKVCRDMFLKTFQITTQKVTTSLVKLRKGGLLNDGRGMNTGGMNKLPDEEHNFITDIIRKLPKYESHYRREKNSGTLYLQPGMTLPNIYDIYQQEYLKKFGEERKCASLASVKKIFYSKFNLKCKPLKKDTCNKCDMLNVKIQNAKNREETEEAQKEKNLHLERAENLRNKMNSDFKTAQDLPNVECLTFDMEKTLPLPRIPTNVVFYKRQLWLYNSGIHSASDDTGHCYVWVEGEAGRGAQEVGSCLLKYIETKLSPTVEHLILWSDCCGGQNRNIKIVLMLKAILNSHETLKTVTFRFLESGHTFLPNDTDFSKIETALKHQQRIFTAEEYIDIIKKCKKRKPLQVYRMKKTDFYSTHKLDKNITNRKKFTDKSKVNWIQTKEIKVTSNRKFSLFMKSSLEEDCKELDIGKKVKGEELNINKSDFTLLWPDGKPIAPAKLNDLESMYQYIPEDCLQFYKTLKSSEDITDDIDGYGGEPDFDLQEEREDD